MHLLFDFMMKNFGCKSLLSAEAQNHADISVAFLLKVSRTYYDLSFTERWGLYADLEEH